MRSYGRLVWVLCLLGISACMPVAPRPASTPAVAAVGSSTVQPTSIAECVLTPPDMLGPFYVAGAPQRNQVGEGYVLRGHILGVDGCRPLPGAQIEFWLAGPDGEYSDATRATWFADGEGAYSFASNLPAPYAGRPPHIHVRVTASGYVPLVTQHYPGAGDTAGVFDLVLAPEQ